MFGIMMDIGQKFYGIHPHPDICDLKVKVTDLEFLF